MTDDIPEAYAAFVAKLPDTAVAILTAYDSDTMDELDDALDALQALDPDPTDATGLATFSAFLMLKLGGWSVQVIEGMGASVEFTGRRIAAALGDPIAPGDADAETRGRNLAARMYVAGLTNDEDQVQAILNTVDNMPLMEFTAAAAVELCGVVAHLLDDLRVVAAGLDMNPN